jgi:DNA-3-methyladenine glycosylase II
MRSKETLVIPCRIDSKPLLIRACQTSSDRLTLDFTSSPFDEGRVKEIASYVLSLDLDLQSFYKIAGSDKRLEQIVGPLYGLGPLRPASIFEMIITAITEQQISLQVANAIRDKIAASFGEVVEETPVFPSAAVLAKASLQTLLACSLSHRKAECILDLSKMVANHQFDLEELARLPDDEVFDKLTQIRGVGPWTADYVLVRGLGRPDRVPAEDVGLRNVVGRYLGSGPRASPHQVVRLLEPFSPFKGLAAFYLLAHERLDKQKRYS